MDIVKYVKKPELQIGVWYEGDSRNSSFAKWNGSRFEYVRHRFSYEFIDEVSCVEDACDWEDIFIPEKPVDDVIVVIQLEKDFNKVKGD